MKKEKATTQRPAQKQLSPGHQLKMRPQPQVEKRGLKGSGRLKGQVALVSGGDSGIGQAVADLYAKKGADVAIVYLKEHRDAKETKHLVEEKGCRCLLIAGDIGNEKFCQSTVRQTVAAFGRLDVLVNNAAKQHPQTSIEKITERQLEKTFHANIFSYFFMTKASLKYLIKHKGVIINTTSVTAYRGSDHLLNYSATKGAIVSFTRSLPLALIEKGVRVKGVAPSLIWTPLIPSTLPGKKVRTFGSDVPMKRAGEPAEVAPCYLFLASSESSYMSGQILHPNGGEVINT